MAFGKPRAFVFKQQSNEVISMSEQETITPIKVKSGKEMLIDELKATVAAKKKRGWSHYRTLEEVRKENERCAKYGVGVSEEELSALVTAGYTTARSSRLDRASEIVMVPPEWLWEGRLSLNQLTHFAGESSEGKSPVTLDLVARVTTGADWPDGTKNTVGVRSAIIMASEDDWADTIIPRLKLAGADLSKVFRFVSTISKDDSTVDVSTKLDTDLEELKKRIIELGDVGLVVIDPITNYLGSKSMNKEEDIRSILMPISEQIAQAMRVCIVTVGHLNKQSKDATPQQRVMGAAAFKGVCRSLVMFAPDPDETSKKYHHIMGEERNKAVPVLKYRTEKVPVGWEGWEGTKVLRVVWGGVSTANIEDSINPDKEETRAAIEVVVPALRMILPPGTKMTAQQCKEAVMGGAYKDRPDNFWHRARKKAGVGCKQEGKQWRWFSEELPSFVQQFDDKEIETHV
jgi:hypothetical protein